MARRSVLHLVIWLGLWFAVDGCGDAADSWTPVTCGVERDVLRGATFARERDYFAVFRDFNGVALPSDKRVIDVTELGSSGEPCKGATDFAACMSALEAVTQVREACEKEQRCGVFAVVSVGDQVMRIDERAEFVAWLAPIDTLSDALTISTWDEKQIVCPASDEPGTRFELDGDTYKFATEFDNCGVQRERDSWEVSRAGAVSGTEIEKLGESGCAI